MNGMDQTGRPFPRVGVTVLRFSEMGNRNVHQCRQKWVLSLDPSLKKGVFSRSEDLRLYAYAFFDHTPDWPSIAKSIPGRTAKQCRERCAYLKKHFTYWWCISSNSVCYRVIHYLFESFILSNSIFDENWSRDVRTIVGSVLKTNSMQHLRTNQLSVVAIVSILLSVKCVIALQQMTSSDDVNHYDRRLLDACSSTCEQT